MSLENISPENITLPDQTPDTSDLVLQERIRAIEAGIAAYQQMYAQNTQAESQEKPSFEKIPAGIFA